MALKVARHPSETMERLWLRVLAYAWKWREGISFGPGPCEPDAPDLVAVAPGGRASLIVRVELAAVDERRIEVVVTLFADHLYVELNGRTLDGPLHRATC